ncbi:MAG TPA: DUF4430 domain-containing protein [Solirubrobacteraceae bacterium]|nr:DUF4430 domain-containing protein [Solirubrobacteraceae bacterium]
MIRPLAVALAAALAAVLAGCGVGAGQAPTSVRLTVTDDFGHRQLLALDGPRVRGEDTVMRLLQRNAKVTTRYGGGFVQSIDGLAGGSAGGGHRDWFYFVNGVEAGEGAAATTVQRGDRIWWDRRDWTAAQEVPAVVGSFPEPFLHGLDGRRLPVRVECADPRAPVCRAVQDRLVKLGVVAGIGTLSASRSVESIRVVVGPWSRVGQDAAVRLIAQGPGASGVFARFADGGRALQLLGPDGRVRRTAGAGSGLIAALRVRGEQPVWTITGTDDAGVEAASLAFEEGALSDNYALAVVDDQGVGLPVARGARP